MWYLRSKLYELTGQHEKSAENYIAAINGDKSDRGYSKDMMMKKLGDLILSMNPQLAEKYILEVFKMSKRSALSVLLRYNNPRLISDRSIYSLIFGESPKKLSNINLSVDDIDHFIAYMTTRINRSNSSTVDGYTILIEAYCIKALVLLEDGSAKHTGSPEAVTHFRLESEYIQRCDKSVSFIDFLKGKNDKLSLARLALIEKLEAYFPKYDINKVNSTISSLTSFWEEKARILQLQELWIPAIETAIKIENYSLADEVCINSFKKVDDNEKCRLADFFLSLVLDKYSPDGKDSFLESLLLKYSRYVDFLGTICNLPGTLNPKVFTRFATTTLRNKIDASLTNTIARELCIKSHDISSRKARCHSKDSINLENSTTKCGICGKDVNLSDSKILPSKIIVHGNCNTSAQSALSQ